MTRTKVIDFLYFSPQHLGVCIQLLQAETLGCSVPLPQSWFLCALKKIRLVSATFYYGRRILADCSSIVSSEEISREAALFLMRLHQMSLSEWNFWQIVPSF